MAITPLHRLSPKEWEALSEKAQWDIKVALRGPDCVSPETLKWFSTAVLRGVMINAFRVGGTVNVDLRLIVLPNDGPSAKDVGWNWRHFSEHISAAAHWLHIPILPIGFDSWWENRKLDPLPYAQMLIKAPSVPIPAAEELKRHCHISWGLSCPE